jgi:ribosome recycling factor
MNTERRKRIEKVISQLAEARCELESIRDDEQEAFDNLPESFQNSEKGSTIQEGLETLEDAVCGIEEKEMALQEIVG